MKFPLKIALLLSASACSDPPSRSDALKAADDYMLAELGGARSQEVTIKKEADAWVVSYPTDAGYAGGTCYVSVDHHTMKVINHVCSQ